MANSEKHKRNRVLDWLADEEGIETAQSRSSRVVGASGKSPNSVARKLPPSVMQPPPRPDLALIREPAMPPRAERPSQLSSMEHLRKLDRLPRLRAPVTHKATPPASKPAAPVPRSAPRKPARPAAPRTRGR